MYSLDYNEIGIKRDGNTRKEAPQSEAFFLGTPKIVVLSVLAATLSLSKCPARQNEISNLPVWRSRGYMPHLNQVNLLQSVTFRLADTLPMHILEQLEDELRALPKAKKNTEFRRKVEAYLDSGSGCCALNNNHLAFVMQETLLKFDGDKYNLLACVHECPR